MRLLPVLAIFVLGAAALPKWSVAQVGAVSFWSFQGSLSWGLTEPMERVVRGREEFRKLWAAIHTTPATEGRSLPHAPEVDFRTEMVIAVGMGQRSHGGYRISVERIQDNGERLVVFYTTSSPGAKCMTSQSITSPVTLVRLPMSHKPVMFGARHEILDCAK